MHNPPLGVRYVHRYVKRTRRLAPRAPCPSPKFQAPVLLSYEQVAIQPNRTRLPILIRNGTARTQATIKAIERARARVVHTQRACCTASLSWCAPSRFHQYAPAAPTAAPITYPHTHRPQRRLQRAAARACSQFRLLTYPCICAVFQEAQRSARTHALTHSHARLLARAVSPLTSTPSLPSTK